MVSIFVVEVLVVLRMKLERGLSDGLDGVGGAACDLAEPSEGHFPFTDCYCGATSNIGTSYKNWAFQPRELATFF